MLKTNGVPHDETSVEASTQASGLESKNALTQRLAQGGGWAMALRFASIGLLFVLQVVLTRWLGLQGYGEFAYALTWANILAFIATVGMDRAALRFVAQYRAINNSSLLRGFIQRSTQIGLLGSLVCTLFLIGVALALRGQMSQSQFVGLLVAACFIPVLAQAAINDTTLLGLGQISQAHISGVLRPTVTIVLSLVASLAMGLKASPFLVLVLYGLASAISWRVAFWYIQRWLRLEKVSVEKQFQTRLWLSAGVPLMLVLVLNFMQNQSGIILSGLFLGPKQAGLFAAASRVSESALFGFHSINTVAAPIFAAMYIKKDYSQLRRFAHLCTWGSTGVTLLVLIPLFLFGRSLMKIFGLEFVDAYPILLILLVNPLVMSLAGSVNYLLNMTGHQNLCLKIFAITTAIYFLLCFLLIPLAGTLGIALSNVLTTILWNLILLYYVRKHLGFWCCVGKM